MALRADLFRELEIVREQGYATNFGESEIGVSGVAVAVSVPNIAPRALAVAAPRVRLSKCVRTNAFRIFSTHCGGTIHCGGSRPLNNSENISAEHLTGVAGTCNPRRDALVGTPKVGVVDAHNSLSWSRCSSSHQFERMAHNHVRYPDWPVHTRRPDDHGLPGEVRCRALAVGSRGLSRAHREPLPSGHFEELPPPFAARDLGVLGPNHRP
ncbi:MAG: hypothetical protein EOO27_09630 [Comamonadaceae bacterium]|nr:MAG: hypothetical protein EOO27_09630 [Comamonadaceae bacterium]